MLLPKYGASRRPPSSSTAMTKKPDQPAIRYSKQRSMEQVQRGPPICLTALTGNLSVCAAPTPRTIGVFTGLTGLDAATACPFTPLARARDSCGADPEPHHRLREREVERARQPAGVGPLAAG